MRETNEQTLNALMQNQGCKFSAEFFADPVQVLGNYKMIAKQEEGHSDE